MPGSSSSIRRAIPTGRIKSYKGPKSRREIIKLIRDKTERSTEKITQIIEDVFGEEGYYKLIKNRKYVTIPTLAIIEPKPLIKRRRKKRRGESKRKWRIYIRNYMRKYREENFERERARVNKHWKDYNKRKEKQLS